MLVLFVVRQRSVNIAEGDSHHLRTSVEYVQCVRGVIYEVHTVSNRNQSIRLCPRAVAISREEA